MTNGIVCKDGSRVLIAKATDESEGYIADRERGLVTVATASGEAYTANCSWDELRRIMSAMSARSRGIPHDVMWNQKVSVKETDFGKEMRLSISDTGDSCVIALLPQEQADELAKLLSPNSFPKE